MYPIKSIKITFGLQYLDLEFIDDMVESIMQKRWPIIVESKRPCDLIDNVPLNNRVLDFPNGYDIIKAARNKINDIREDLLSWDEPQLFRTLWQACRYLQNQCDRSVLIDICDFFDVPQFLANYTDNKAGDFDESFLQRFHESINESGAIYYVNNANYEYCFNNGSYKTLDHATITMPTSIGKYPYLNIECLTKDGKPSFHAATLEPAVSIRGYNGRNLFLRVLGELYLENKCFYIKPYLIEFVC